MQIKNYFGLVIRCIFLVMSACILYLPGKAETDIYDNDVVFSSFRYVADSCWANVKIDTNSEYRNPILPGTMPDPSICRKGQDYYIVNSSFCYFPALPVWHSRDLIHWESLGNVITRESQLDLGTVDINSGVFAADIKYNSFNNYFYVIVHNVYSGGISIYTSASPESRSWSDPVHPSNIYGIDPSFLFDTDGKTYIVSSSASTNPDYDGEQSIWLIEYNWKAKTTVGTPIEIVRGGYQIKNKPFALEGPHLYHINDQYYLMAAQGGTGLGHEEVIFQSSSPTGPFTACLHNPILSQNYLSEKRLYAITCAGHADLVETADGNWYSVFLASRNYIANFCNTGRETFMLPVKWVDKQPVILDSLKEVPYAVTMSSEQKQLKTGNSINGFDFYKTNNLWDSQGLKDGVVAIRNPRNFYSVDSSGNLRITLSDVGLNEMKSPSMLLQRLTNPTFTITSDFKFKPYSLSDSAGIVFYLSDKYYIQISKKLDATGNQVLSLGACDNSSYKELSRKLIFPSDEDEKLYLKIVSDLGYFYRFYYSYDGLSYQLLGKADATILSNSHAGGYTGVSVGIFGAGKKRKIDTGILNIPHINRKIETVYDIYGRVLDRVTKNGIYLINGKKQRITTLNN